MTIVRPTPTFLVLLLFLAACSLPRGAALQSEVTKAADAEDAPFAVYPVTRTTVDDFQRWPRTVLYHNWLAEPRGLASPVISAGDRIDMVIWDNSENSLLLSEGQKLVEMKNIQVGNGGTVFIPYLDKVHIAGLTPDGARGLIQRKMGEILPSAQVQLVYTAGARSSVSLVGGVSAPGTFPLPDRNVSVLNLISLGGGVSPTMRNPQVKLMRGGKTYRVSLEQLYSDAALDTVLRGGDKVIVEQDDRYFQALGATGEEDLIYFSKDQISALEAVSIVGGITDTRADPKGVLVLRVYDPSHIDPDASHGPQRTDVVFVIDLTTADGLFSAKRFEIQHKDVVLVTESPVTKAQTIFGLIGSAFGLARQAQVVSN